MFRSNRKNNIHVICMCVFILLSFILLPYAVYAENKGSVTIECVYDTGGERVVFENDEYAVVKIADAEVSESSGTIRCITVDRFKKYDRDWNNCRASSLRETAKAIKGYIEKNRISTPEKASGKNGIVLFKNLDPGLYLIYRTKTDNSKYKDMPVIISVPEMINGEPVYNVHIQPKYSKDSSGTTKSKTNDSRKAPQTGDVIFPALLLVIILYLLYVVRVIISPSREKKEK